MLVSDFDYNLPKKLIAQYPSEKRDESRLLLLNRKTGEVKESVFKDIFEHLHPSDLLVLNETKVIPARIYGNISNKTDKQVELLLLREIEPNIWEALSRPAKKLKPGVVINYKDAQAKILERKESGIRVAQFSGKDVHELLQEQGEIALPPYIKSKVADINRYQTVYAQKRGAIAAPTAGLHFTQELLQAITKKGIEIQKITLHSGLGTFRPVKEELVEKHKMYHEEFEINEQVTKSVNNAKIAKRRVIAAGTTVVRALESQVIQNNNHWLVKANKGMTDLYIYPGYKFKIIDAMLTNFHLPKSTLLMLVCAFTSKEFIFKAYNYAIKNKFRFYSFGDAMFIF
jgi:S-adenosylmethionine:tRNA ribosyltransferase-isomerase